ncbi:hypothetical protein H2198_000605 [Neophaeococcomyces mojaviensis]|uniref:Uncharacterized protein n=1 Tax=Neophaeococcomyces mojaviensis TaxID=3383035 RepID=A0ACC3AK09_9EURO|nr:hypothetical protein H2198_000605 [Knufia sp. JES_112]
MDELSQHHGNVYNGITASGSARLHLGDIHFHDVRRAVADEEASELQRQALLKSLAFQDMNSRRVQLENGPSNHLEWIWEHAGFLQWIRSDIDVFWISGKPASGKSTLMNYIVRHGKCSELLRSCTGKDWTLVRFFFDFRAGKTNANTQEGMLRSFLFQLVDAVPVAASYVLQSVPGRNAHIEYNDKSSAELLEIIRAAIVAAHIHVCAFIDGLDEFEGSIRDLMDAIHKLCDGAALKLCLASRPEVAISNALRGVPYVRMQDHNQKTICDYAESCFNSIPGSSLSLSERDLLIQQITAESDGVILWTRLVCSEVVDGLLASETLEEIQLRVSCYPQDLDHVYERLLNQASTKSSLANSRHETAIALCFVQIPKVAEAMVKTRLAAKVLKEILEFAKNIGVLPGYPTQKLSIEAFYNRLQSRLGGLVDVTPGENLRLVHKTLETYLERSNWIEHNLPVEFLARYPNHVWLRFCCDYLLHHTLSENQAVVFTPALFSCTGTSTDNLLAPLAPELFDAQLNHNDFINFAASAMPKLAEAAAGDLNLDQLIRDTLSCPQLGRHFGADCCFERPDIYEYWLLPPLERALLLAISHGLWRHAESIFDLMPSQLSDDTYRRVVRQIMRCRRRLALSGSQALTVARENPLIEKWLRLATPHATTEELFRLSKLPFSELVQSVRFLVTFREPTTWPRCHPLLVIYLNDESLLPISANDQVKPWSPSPLWWAWNQWPGSTTLEMQELELFELLVNSGEDINRSHYPYISLLHAAVMYEEPNMRMVELVKFLIKRGVEPTKEGPSGTPLQLAEARYAEIALNGQEKSAHHKRAVLNFVIQLLRQATNSSMSTKNNTEDDLLNISDEFWCEGGLDHRADYLVIENSGRLIKYDMDEHNTKYQVSSYPTPLQRTLTTDLRSFGSSWAVREG